jgi:hypothetical protein
MQDLISLCSQHILQPTTSTEQSAELVFLVNKTAAAMEVVGGSTSNNNLKDEATKLSRDLAPQIAADLPQFEAAIKAVFLQVKAPPTLVPAPSPGSPSPSDNGTVDPAR